MQSFKDDEEPQDLNYAYDGNYVPRIYFVDKTGKVRHDIFNEVTSKKYKYFYPDADTSKNFYLKKMISKLNNNTFLYLSYTKHEKGIRDV